MTTDNVDQERLYATTEPAVWTDEFMGVVERGATVDWGLMVAWFANAIATATADLAEHAALPVAECSECGVAYVLRPGVNLATGRHVYTLQRDCKHGRRRPEPQVRVSGDEPVLADLTSRVVRRDD